MSKSIDVAQSALLALEEQNDARKIDISLMELANGKLLEQLKKRDEALEESKRLLQAEATQHEIVVDKVSSNIT